MWWRFDKHIVARFEFKWGIELNNELFQVRRDAAIRCNLTFDALHRKPVYSLAPASVVGTGPRRHDRLQRR